MKEAIPLPEFTCPSQITTTVQMIMDHPVSLLWLVLPPLIVWRLIDLALSSRQCARQQKSIPVAETTRQETVKMPPAYASQEHAQAVFQLANVNYYQYLLAEFRTALRAEGYELTRDKERQVPFTHECETRIARTTLIARERYYTPGQSDDVLEERVHQSVRDGYALQWINWLISGSESQGWFITRTDTPEH